MSNAKMILDSLTDAELLAHARAVTFNPPSSTLMAAVLARFEVLVEVQAAVDQAVKEWEGESPPSNVTQIIVTLGGMKP